MIFRQPVTLLADKSVMFSSNYLLVHLLVQKQIMTKNKLISNILERGRGGRGGGREGDTYSVTT